MGTTLEFIESIVCRSEDKARHWGELDDSYFLSLTGNVFEKTVFIATSTTKTLYDGANEVIATASFVSLRADQTCAVELTFDTANVAGTTKLTFSLLGTGISGEFGPPLTFPDCKAYCGYTSPFAGGTFYYVDKILVKNLSSTLQAQVDFLFGS